LVHWGRPATHNPFPTTTMTVTMSRDSSSLFCFCRADLKRREKRASPTTGRDTIRNTLTNQQHQNLAGGEEVVLITWTKK
jgi:hypothetical protein